MKSTILSASIKDVENFWDSRPCNIRHSNAIPGSLEFYNDVSRKRYFVEPHIVEFADFSSWAGKRVLEVGCGIGIDACQFALAGAHVTAVDLTSKSIEIAKAHSDVLGLGERMVFYKADVERLSDVLPIEYYDLVYSLGVIHHTPNPRLAINEIKKYMNGSSVLKILLYNRYSWKVFQILLRYKFAFWRLNEIVSRHSEAQQMCPVTYTFTRRKAKELLSGFDIRRMYVRHIFPYSIPEYVRHEYKKTPIFSVLPNCVYSWMQKVVGWHLCIEAVLMNQRRK